MGIFKNEDIHKCDIEAMLGFKISQVEYEQASVLAQRKIALINRLYGTSEDDKYIDLIIAESVRHIKFQNLTIEIAEVLARNFEYVKSPIDTDQSK